MIRGTYIRKMSYNERMFIAADRICPPVVNQLLFDGHGVLDAHKWRSAVVAASDACPGSRVRLKGLPGRGRWVDSGEPPEVLEIDGSGWDGTGPEGAPFLLDKMDVSKGPLSQVLLIHGNPLRVCFRTHHAIMDGRGTMTWAEEIFKALRGGDPAGASSAMTDIELVRSVRSDYRKAFAKDSIAPTGNARGDEGGVTWKRIVIPGRFKNILGQVPLLSAREAWRYGEGPVRFTVPVDLRRHCQGLRSTANLSIAVYIDIQPDSTAESIASDIKQQLADKSDCLIDRYDPLIRYVPIWFMVLRGNTIIRKNRKTGRYGSSGIISNMGQVPLDVYSGGGFNASMFWGIPPAFENVPYFMGITYSHEALNLILTLPKALAGDKRIDRIFENIKNGLVQV